MFDFTKETPITLRQAAELLPGAKGKKIHWQTVNRWVRLGLRGVRLEAIYLGGQLVTSVEALQRFTESITAIRTSERDVVMPGCERPRRDRRNTDAILARHGL